MHAENQKSEIRNGLRHLLAFSLFYDSFQHLVGAYQWRKRVVENHITPLCTNTTRILDIGCGTGEILNYIPSQVKYFGFDRNQEYVASAKNRFANKNAEFVCEDVNKNSISKYGNFDIVLAIGILHHLDDVIAHELFETAHNVLNEGGVLLALDPVYTQSQSAAAKYIVGKDRGQAVRTDTAYVKIAEKHFKSTQVLIDEHPLRIPYTGIIMTCIKN